MQTPANKTSVLSISAALLTVAVLCGVWPRAHADIVDAVLATVDKEVILRSDIMQEIAPSIEELRRTSTDEQAFNREAENRIRAALDQAIENKILLREALLAGMQITDEGVEKRIEEIRKRYASSEEFQKAIEDSGETMGDFRDHIRKQILAISFGMQKRRDFEEEAVVSEADMAQYYEDHKSELGHPERVRLLRIFLAADADPAERPQVRARLAELRDQLAAGADFEALAKSASEGPEAEKGGVIGWAVRGDLVPELEAVAFSLPEGQLSDVVETEFGFHVLKVVQKEESGVPTLDEMRTTIEPELRRRYGDERYTSWIAELRKRSRVRVFM